MAFHKGLVIQLIWTQKLRRKSSEKSECQVLPCTLFQNAFLYSHIFRFWIFFSGDFLEKSQPAHQIQWPVVGVSVFQSASHKRTHGIFFDKNSIRNLGQIGTDQPFLTRLAYIGFQYSLTFLAVVRSEDQKLQNSFFQVSISKPRAFFQMESSSPIGPKRYSIR